MGNSNFEDKRVLVTGGKGYLGSLLVQSLKKAGAKVSLIALEASEADNEYQVDICNKEELSKVIQKICPDIIYHLAAIIDRQRDFSIYDKMMKINVDGTLNLLQALKDIDYQNLIFTSSSEIYGNNESPFRENQPPMPTSPYSLSKVYGEQLIKTFSDTYHKGYTVLRIFNFYGPNMSEGFFIPQIIETLRRDEDFSMTKGEQTRDFMFVDDTIQALLLAGCKKEAIGQTFNVCSGYGTSIQQLASEIAKKMPDSKGKIQLGAIPYRDNEVWEMIGDNTKITESLGFAPTTSLSDGIELCIKGRN